MNFSCVCSDVKPNANDCLSSLAIAAAELWLPVSECGPSKLSSHMLWRREPWLCVFYIISDTQEPGEIDRDHQGLWGALTPSTAAGGSIQWS